MFGFLRDMLIGWIIFTPEGKDVANKVFTKTYNQLKKNIVKSEQFKEIINIKNVILDGGKNESKSNDRTKN